MPRIPTDDVQPQQQSLEAGSVPRLGPNVFGEYQADALTRLGNQVDEGFNRVGEVYARAKASRITTDAQKQLGDYANNLKNGVDPESGQSYVDEKGSPRLDANGQPMRPPDPADHAQMLQTKMDEIRGKSEGQLGGNAIALSHFNNEYNAFSSRLLLDTKSDALHFMQQKIRANADLDLQTRASNSVNFDDISRSETERQAMDHIDTLVNNRVYSPEEGFAAKERFVKQVEVGHIRNMMESGKYGPMDVIAGLQKGEFSKLPLDVQERFYDVAAEKQYRNDRREQMTQQHADAAQEKQERKTANDAFLEGIGLNNKGQLTPQWLERNQWRFRGNPTHFEALSHMSASGSETPSNKEVEADLLVRGHTEDVSDEAMKEWKKHNLNAKSYEHIMETTMRTEDYKLNQPYIAGHNEIKARLSHITDFGKALPNLGTAQTDAHEAWREWWNENKANKPAPDEVQTAKDHIVNSALREARMTVDLSPPMFLKGGRNALFDEKNGPVALQEAKKQVVAAFRAKQITKEKLNEQAVIIDQWSKLFAPAPPPTATQGNK